MLEKTHSEPALFSERMSAFAVDVALFAAMFIASLKAVSPSETILMHSKGYVMAWMFVGFFILYHAYFSSEGRVSLGKYLLGLLVLDGDGEPLTILQALLRSAAYLLSATASLGFIWILFNSNRQGWHDIIAGTHVVRMRPRTAASKWFAMAGAWCFALIIALSYTWQLVLATPYYHLRTALSAQRGLEEIGRLEQIHYGLYDQYTTDLERLGGLSSNPLLFKESLNQLFDPAFGVRINATSSSYTIDAHAIDRSHIPVRLVGP